MRNKERLLAVGATVLATVAIGVVLWMSFGPERQGVHDERFENPTADQIASFEGCLVHSIEQFDAHYPHLTAWYIDKQPDGSYARHWVATTDAWYRLHNGGRTRVIQLRESFMAQHLPTAHDLTD